MRTWKNNIKKISISNCKKKKKVCTIEQLFHGINHEESLYSFHPTRINLELTIVKNVIIFH